MQVAEASWHDWRIELLLLCELAVRSDSVDATIRLYDSILHHTGRQFDGTMSSWRAIFEEHADGLVFVRRDNPVFFGGLNHALLSLFKLAVPDENGLLPDPTELETGRIIAIMTALQNPRGPLSTRVKALHLLLLARTGVTKQSLAEADGAAREIMEESSTRTAGEIRARWIAMRSFDRQVNIDYVAAFVEFGLEIPCNATDYIPPRRKPWPMKDLTEIADAVDAAFGALLADSRPAIPTDVSDVIIGNLVRIRQLTHRVLNASSEDDGMVSEILLRSLVDSAVQIRWLFNKNDPALYSQFKARSLASERDAIENLQQELKTSGMSDDDAWNIVREDYAGIGERLGRWPELLSVVYGPWSDIPTSRMARELDRLLLTTFQRTSDSAHGSWRSIEKFQLSLCNNPLHPRHYVPAAEERRSAGIVPVVSALLTAVNVLAAACEVMAASSSLGLEVQKIDASLRQWIIDHQSTFGVFDWESVEE
jgi:hypothetical protein